VDNAVELTELYDLEVERHDGVANPASGFSFLVTKSAATAAPTVEETVAEDATKDAPVEPTESATETPAPEVEKAEGEAAPSLTAESVQELIKAALAERDSEAESRIAKAEAERDAAKSALDVLKATPTPGGPVISATAEQRAFKAKNEAMQKAAYYRRLAETVNDRELAVEYRNRAKAAEAEAA
jgi:hypothetical protein